MIEFETMFVESPAPKAYTLTITFHLSSPTRTLHLIFQSSPKDYSSQVRNFKFFQVRSGNFKKYFARIKTKCGSSLLRINENIIIEQGHKAISSRANGEYKAICSNMVFGTLGVCSLVYLWTPWLEIHLCPSGGGCLNRLWGNQMMSATQLHTQNQPGNPPCTKMERFTQYISWAKKTRYRPVSASILNKKKVQNVNIYVCIPV